MFPEMMSKRAEVPGMFMASTNPGQSMFHGLAPNAGPTPDQMAEERNRVLARKHVELATHSVKIFDMHEAKEAREYEKLMKELIAGSQAMTHKIWINERALVNSGAKGQRWMIYLEWSVFVLHETQTDPLGTPDTAKGRRKIKESTNE